MPASRDFTTERRIVVSTQAVDGYRATRQFATLADARKYAHDRVGAHPEFGTGYAVSSDGIVTVSVMGASLADLFPERTD